MEDEESTAFNKEYPDFEIKRKWIYTGRNCPNIESFTRNCGKNINEK